jgi:hypothetical protein
MNRHRFAAPIMVIAVVSSAVIASAGAISAQDSISLEDHPNVGAWMVATPIGPALAVFHADGTLVQGVPATQAGPQGVSFVSAQAGMWEPVDDRTVHFTAPFLLSDADGAFTGTVTVDAYHTVSEDGQTFISDPARSTVTIRDAQNTVLDVIEGGPPAIGTRMAVGAPGFPETAAASPSPAP